MDWQTAWQVAGEVCDLLHKRDGYTTTMQEHERIATIIQQRAEQKFNTYMQSFEPQKGGK